jgi:D-glycero-D-manno-heptose 1,7-bisphosphate phosphatase
MGIDRNRPRAVFLDRDGVITRAVVRDGRPYPPASADTADVLPGVPRALRRLKAAGYMLVVVTNQPDVARGAQSRAEVETIHARLASLLPIDEFRACFHDDGDGCACRKPKPGMIIDAARDHQLDLSASVMVGDRWRDVEAGREAGCATVFIDRGYAEPAPDHPDVVVASLEEAADWILTRHGEPANDPH